MIYKRTRPSMPEILGVTLSALKISPKDWEERRKTRRGFVVRIKELFSLLAFEQGYSHKEIGEFIGLHRTSVINRIRTLKEYCTVYPGFHDTVEDARLLIKGFVTEGQLEDVTIGYLARSHSGMLTISPVKPERVCGYWISEGSRPYYPQSSFPQLTWESEPVIVKIRVTIQDYEEM